MSTNTNTTSQNEMSASTIGGKFRIHSGEMQIQEDIMDLKCRFMWDNLLFYGLSEGKTLGLTSLLSQDHTSNAACEWSVDPAQSLSDTWSVETKANQPMSETLSGTHSVLYSEIRQREPVLILMTVKRVCITYVRKCRKFQMFRSHYLLIVLTELECGSLVQ